MFNKKHTCLLPVRVISVISKYELNISLHVLLAQPQKIVTLRAITFKNGCNITGIVRFEPLRVKMIVVCHITAFCHNITCSLFLATLNTLENQRIKLHPKLKQLKEFLSSNNQNIEERFGCPYRKTFLQYLGRAYPENRVACLIGQDLYRSTLFSLNDFLDTVDFPQLNSTLDLDLVQLTDWLHALSQNTTHHTRQQLEAVKYFETCKQRVVEDLTIEDHHFTKRAGGLECPIPGCDKVLARKDGLDRHLKTHLPLEEREEFPCTVPGCPRVFYRKDHLKQHLKTHSSDI